MPAGTREPAGEGVRYAIFFGMRANLSATAEHQLRSHHERQHTRCGFGNGREWLKIDIETRHDREDPILVIVHIITGDNRSMNKSQTAWRVVKLNGRVQRQNGSVPGAIWRLDRRRIREIPKHSL